MIPEQQDSERDRAELKRNILLLAISLLVVLGLGWGLTYLFGYHWIIVDFEAAPKWSVRAAFIAMPITSVIIGFAVGDGSRIELGVKTVIVGVSFIVLWGRPWLDPVLLATLCGMASMALVALAGQISGMATEPGKRARQREDHTGPQPDKAERRRRDDEARRLNREREQRAYESRKIGDEKPAED
jgi:hypothetical protein